MLYIMLRASLIVQQNRCIAQTQSERPGSSGYALVLRHIDLRILQSDDPWMVVLSSLHLSKNTNLSQAFDLTILAQVFTLQLTHTFPSSNFNSLSYELLLIKQDGKAGVGLRRTTWIPHSKSQGIMSYY